MSRTHLGLLLSPPGAFLWVSAPSDAFFMGQSQSTSVGPYCLWRVSVPTPGSPTTCAHPTQQRATQDSSRRSTADENYTFHINSRSILESLKYHGENKYSFSKYFKVLPLSFPTDCLHALWLLSLLSWEYFFKICNSTRPYPFAQLIVLLFLFLFDSHSQNTQQLGTQIRTFFGRQ